MIGNLMGNLKDQIGKIVVDLTTLEINTILKQNIQGMKMPQPMHALLDIAKEFDIELQRQGVKRLNNHNDQGGHEAFNQIRERAALRIAEINHMKGERLSPAETSDLLMLHRIKEQSDQIKGIFISLKKKGFDIPDKGYTREEINSMTPVAPFTPSDITLIRKIWELGTEEIAMQTVVQLDGDVITRVKPSYAVSDYAVIHEIHKSSVGISISLWKDIVEVVKVFFDSITKKIFG